ncbi:MAG TPA: nitroreductase family protein, partial [Algoriphagus sp.]|nr:nitroreductase family protein [Algoriphagus sp.]
MEKKLINGHLHVSYRRPKYSDQESQTAAKKYFEFMNQRRTVREFDSRNIPLDVMENIIQTTGTAPSGAHKQPWTFCLISDPEMKKQIRIAAEEEEKI